MAGLVEIPATFLAAHAVDSLGRRRAVVGSMLLSGCFCVSLMTFDVTVCLSAIADGMSIARV